MGWYTGAIRAAKSVVTNFTQTQKERKKNRQQRKSNKKNIYNPFLLSTDKKRQQRNEQDLADDTIGLSSYTAPSDFSLQLYPNQSTTTSSVSAASTTTTSRRKQRPISSFLNQSPRSVIIDHLSTPTTSFDEDEREYNTDDVFTSLLGRGDDDDDRSGISSLESLDHLFDDLEEFDTDDYMPDTSSRKFAEELRAGLNRLSESMEYDDESEEESGLFSTDSFMLPPPATMTSLEAFHPNVAAAATAASEGLLPAIVSSDEDDDELEDLEFDTDDYMMPARSLKSYAESSPPQRPATSLSQLQQELLLQEQYLAATTAAAAATNPYAFSPQRHQQQPNYVSSAVDDELESLDGSDDDDIMEEIFTSQQQPFYHPAAASSANGFYPKVAPVIGRDIEVSVCFLVVDDDEEDLEWDC